MQISGHPYATVASFHINKPRCSLNKMLCGPHSGSGCFVKEISLVNFAPAENRTLNGIGVTSEGRGGGLISRSENKKLGRELGKEVYVY